MNAARTATHEDARRPSSAPATPRHGAGGDLGQRGVEQLAAQDVADGGVDGGGGGPAPAARGHAAITAKAAAIGAGSGRPVGMDVGDGRRRQQLDREHVLEDLEGLRASAAR